MRSSTFVWLLAGLVACERAHGAKEKKEIRIPPPALTMTLVDPGAEPRVARRFHLRPEVATYERSSRMIDQIGARRVAHPTSVMRFEVRVSGPDAKGWYHDHSRITSTEHRAAAGDAALTKQERKLAQWEGVETESTVDDRGLRQGDAIALADPDADVEDHFGYTAEYAGLLPAEPIGVGARWRIISAAGHEQVTIDATLVAATDDQLEMRTTFDAVYRFPSQTMREHGTADLHISLDREVSTEHAQIHVVQDGRPEGSREVTVDIAPVPATAR
jgi:hypothetical protein